MNADPRPPVNVRLIIDGRRYPCDVIREPGRDTAGGCAAWTAVPLDDLPPVEDGMHVEVLADVLPPMTLLDVRLNREPAEP